MKKEDKIQKDLISDTSGQVLIESIVSISMAVVALLGILALLTSSVGTNKDISARHTAVYLAGEGVEVVKGLIGENYSDDCTWNAGLKGGSYEVVYNASFSSNNCDRSWREVFERQVGSFSAANNLEVDSEGFYDYSSSQGTSFKRIVDIGYEDVDGDGQQDDRMVVKSEVQWTERGGEKRNVQLEEHFYDWRQ